MTIAQLDAALGEDELDLWRAHFARRPPSYIASWWQHADLLRTVVTLVAGSDAAPQQADLMPRMDYGDS